MNPVTCRPALGRVFIGLTAAGASHAEGRAPDPPATTSGVAWRRFAAGSGRRVVRAGVVLADQGAVERSGGLELFGGFA